jgi:hypothetical protein
LWRTVLSFVGTGYRIQRIQWQGMCILVFVLMPPTNPTLHLYLSVTWIRTLGHVGGGNRCGGDTLLRVTTTRWPTGLWSTQTKVESIVLKAAWHWGIDTSVTNGPFVEPGFTPLYGGLLSMLGSVDGDRTFSSHLVGGPLDWGLSQI